ncbi:endo alpha-1,4 polygalactosaminidase [Conexibacter sp. CPCC 206217]|uniref:endo alpha-1,4 polygalactosaminidase n=1 Tax=Conexibacter sp. CPCC 206217 TaxID=3064574 RepID=UPI00271E124F|nr:endo alpha-1,4 polygalactosaminidase [Conexibacter sp. CPCC 206217]MDO8212484.1 endo alpha-1,4 polygalactosaminidase [Conexibacter sp. CPCC 206217]
MTILPLALAVVAAILIPPRTQPAAPAAPQPVADVAARIQRPPPHASWQWQLDGRLDASVPARVYDVDGFDTSAAAVARLHRDGRYVVCYFSAGAWENWRPDRDRFPAATLGADNGWPGERWLDVRRLRALAPVLRDRIAMCARKGFDAVEPDNVDGYANDSGFPLTARDQLRFNRWLAQTAHAHGLAVALKNDLEQARALQPSFDFAVLEQCFQYRECGRARPFLRAGKAVFDAEYALPRERFCEPAKRLGISAIRKRMGLGAWRDAC